MIDSGKSVLMFTIALNGYGTVYARCLASHRRYAKQYGYDYVAITRPRGLVAPDVSSWIKIPLIRHAFASGYRWVFFVDADCLMQPTAPPIESIEIDGKTLYMAPGYSGRVNAGVIIAKNSPQCAEFFSNVIDNAAQAIPEEDKALYENGHVIHYSKDQPYLQILDSRWNNNRDPGLNDYVRHFSAGGPMRKLYKKTLVGFGVHVSNRVQTKVWKKLNPAGTRGTVLRQKIDALSESCIESAFAAKSPATQVATDQPTEVIAHG